MTYDEWSVDRIKAAGRPYIASMQVVMRLLSYPKGRRYVSCMDGTSSLQKEGGARFFESDPQVWEIGSSDFFTLMRCVVCMIIVFHSSHLCL
jgi:hypothetical protein